MSASVKSAKVDRELEIGSSAHYADPGRYEQAYRDREDDVRFYVALAEEHGGPILEYGCGSGRIALPVARAGVAITGVDLSAPMLEAFRAALADEPVEVRRRVKLRRGDMRDVRLRARFPLVLCTFNTFLHLYSREDVERFLAGVRGHLAPGGRFVFDTSLPVPEDLAREPGRAFRGRQVRDPETGVRYGYQERFDYDPIRQVLFVMMEFEPKTTGAGRPFVTPLTHRQFFPLELEALLHYNGFELESCEADFERDPRSVRPAGAFRAHRHADSLVWTCRKRRGW